VKRGSVFYKMTGSGNDFLMFDGRFNRREDFTPERVAALCHRRLGVGADGVILLEPADGTEAHFTFRFWNSDGSEGPMCGNGALCATFLATLIELAPSDDEVRFATLSGLHRGWVVDGRPEIELPDFPVPKHLPGVRTADGEAHPTFARPSVEHLVVLVPDVDKVDLERRGPLLRRDPALGEGGANVNWVSPAGDGTYRMRTYERGVEAETLACGTGAVACALTLEAQGMVRSPVRLWTRSDLPLDVSWVRKPKLVGSVRLRGEGRLVCRGIVGEVGT
jgi:diaminopimelate epimerase